MPEKDNHQKYISNVAKSSLVGELRFILLNVCLICMLRWDLPDCASSGRNLGRTRRGARPLFRGIGTYNVKVIEYRSFYE